MKDIEAIFAVVPVFLLLFLLVSCIKPEPYFKVRMSVQEIQEGAFTGGRLIYSRDERINQLKPGLLIPVKEMVKGWVKEDNSNVHTYQTLSTNYGYYYIVAVDETSITVDYLIYNEIGEILSHKENVQISHSYVVNQSEEETGKTSTGTPDFLSMTRFTDIAGEAYTLSSSLEGAKLLSFPCERPDDSQQMAVNEDETFLSVLFRLQENATTQYDYSSGLICAHYSEPCLVINAALWAEDSYILPFGIFSLMLSQASVFTGDTSVMKSLIMLMGCQFLCFAIWFVFSTVLGAKLAKMSPLEYLRAIKSRQCLTLPSCPRWR